MLVLSPRRGAPGAAALLVAPLAALLAGCVPPPVAARPVPVGVTQHVIVVSIDGLRPDAIARYGARTLLGLMRDGSATLDARTITPPKTLPSHTSMLTGVEPSVHGVTWNSLLDDPADPHDELVEPDSLTVPTIFGLARAAGFHTAAFFSKAKFRFLQSAGTLDYAQAPRSTFVPRGAQRTSEDAAWYVRHRRPHLLFMHVAEPDYAGHTVGWMSAAYGENVRMADRAVARLKAAADDAFGPDGYTLIVTADHGGHGRAHGVDTLSDVRIPWIAYGRGVRRGVTIAAPVRTTDTAATALWLLGVPVPPSWSGRPVTTALVEERRP